MLRRYRINSSWNTSYDLLEKYPSLYFYDMEEGYLGFVTPEYLGEVVLVKCQFYNKNRVVKFNLDTKNYGEVLFSPSGFEMTYLDLKIPSHPKMKPIKSPNYIGYLSSKGYLFMLSPNYDKRYSVSKLQEMFMS